MDLVATIRKDGKSRGGAGNFSWDAVKDDKHRENYLGHSLKAPVGRWQVNKDLSWYSKSDRTESEQLSAEQAEQEARRKEIEAIKAAEREALGKALGYGDGVESTLLDGSFAASLGGSGANSVPVAATERSKPKDEHREERRRRKERHRERRRHHERHRSRSRTLSPDREPARRHREPRDREDKTRHAEDRPRHYRRRSSRSRSRNRSRSRERDRRRHADRRSRSPKTSDRR
jgi:hypothetical protein